jgi:hypothetical protein
MNIITPIIFKTKNGNTYFYDDATLLVFPLITKEKIYEIKKFIETKAFISIYSERVKGLVAKYNLFRRPINQNINVTEYLKNRIKKGSRQLIIELTQDCNFIGWKDNFMPFKRK